jgi:hypothetical protein
LRFTLRLRVWWFGVDLDTCGYITLEKFYIKNELENVFHFEVQLIQSTEKTLEWGRITLQRSEDRQTVLFLISIDKINLILATEVKSLNPVTLKFEMNISLKKTQKKFDAFVDEMLDYFIDFESLFSFIIKEPTWRQLYFLGEYGLEKLALLKSMILKDSQGKRFKSYSYLMGNDHSLWESTEEEELNWKKYSHLISNKEKKIELLAKTPRAWQKAFSTKALFNVADSELDMWLETPEKLSLIQVKIIYHKLFITKLDAEIIHESIRNEIYHLGLSIKMDNLLIQVFISFQNKYGKVNKKPSCFINYFIPFELEQSVKEKGKIIWPKTGFTVNNDGINFRDGLSLNENSKFKIETNFFVNLGCLTCGFNPKVKYKIMGSMDVDYDSDLSENPYIFSELSKASLKNFIVELKKPFNYEWNIPSIIRMYKHNDFSENPLLEEIFKEKRIHNDANFFLLSYGLTDLKVLEEEYQKYLADNKYLQSNNTAFLNPEYYKDFLNILKPKQ